MTIYISGPMTGKPEYNILNFFRMERSLEGVGVKSLNPAKIGGLPDEKSYWPINKAMLDGADAIIMLRGWFDSAGAQKEFEYAVKRGISVIFEPLGEEDEDT